VSEKKPTVYLGNHHWEIGKPIAAVVGKWNLETAFTELERLGYEVKNFEVVPIEPTFLIFAVPAEKEKHGI